MSKSNSLCLFGTKKPPALDYQAGGNGCIDCCGGANPNYRVLTTKHIGPNPLGPGISYLATLNRAVLVAADHVLDLSSYLIEG